MKPEEAIKAIKGLENIIEYWTYRPDEVITAKLAIQALEKQVPKKPKGISLSHEGRLGNCPYCKKLVYERVNKNGCHECLQRIDWSVEE